MQIQSTNSIGLSYGIKALVYGKAGIGKTFLATTVDAPFIFMTEPGLLSLRRYNIPFVQCRTIAELHNAAKWLATSAEARQFNCFFMDSLTEVLQILLAAEMQRVGQKEPRKAYNELLTQALELIRLFRDIAGPNLIFTAKEEYSQDDEMKMTYRAKFPGRAMGAEAPYFFDEVWQLHLHKDAQGVEHRALRCHPTNNIEAKDRSGALAAIEPADLRYIFAKINQG